MPCDVAQVPRLGTERLPPNAASAAPMVVPAARSAAPRVAIFSDAAPERNGVGAYYRDLAEHLRGHGALVKLISPRYRAGRWYGGLALPLPGDPTQKFLLPSPCALNRRLQHLTPDAIVVPTPGPYGMLGMYFAKRRGTRLVVGFHTHFERLAALNKDWRLFGYVAQAYLNACHRQLFRASDLVLVNSGAMVEIAHTIGARDVTLMGTPIPRQFLDRPPQPLNPRIERVLFAGRLAPEKNLAAIVQAAAALPELCFLVAGDGPLRAWLLAQAARLPNLRCLGWIRRRRLLALIDSVEVLALPSTVESFGTIALEAMARGRLVVVSSQCGILSWEDLNRGLFRMRTGECLADTLRRMQSLDPALRAHKATVARAAAHELHERNLLHWLEILRPGAAPP